MDSSRKELRQEIEELEESLNDMYNFKVEACELVDPVEKTRKSVLIDSAINRQDDVLRMLRLKHKLETAFRAKANKYENYKKSNKYFLTGIRNIRNRRL
jgi:hypothetical protein